MKLLSVLFTLFLSITLAITGIDSQKKPSGNKSRVFRAKISESKIEKNTIVFSPDRNVRKARYNDFIFDKQEFFNIYGKSWEGKKEITCLIVEKKTNNYKPSNPKAQSPVGGFHIQRFHCKTRGSKKTSGHIIPDGKNNSFSYHREVFETLPEFNAYGHAKILTKSGWYLVDKKGKQIHKIYIFDNGPDYEQEGLYRIVQDGKIGFVDKKGKIQVKPIYDFATPFENGIAKACFSCKSIKDPPEHSRIQGGKWIEISNPLMKKK